MMIPGILAQRRHSGVAPALWTPLNMATVPQIYLDAQDSVVTDVSGFASAISNLGAMGANGDFSQGTEANRPVILAAELNGKRVLRFDGVGDFISGSSGAQLDLFRNRSAAWAMAVYKKRGTDGTPKFRPFFATTVGSGQSAVRFGLYAGTGATDAQNKPNIWGRRLDGDASTNLLSSAARSASYLMFLANIEYTTRQARIFIDGTLDASDGAFTASAGSTSDTSSTNPISIGAFFGGGAAADIDLAALIVGNAQPSDADINRLFGWAAHKYGLTASLPSDHPYKTTPPYA